MRLSTHNNYLTTFVRWRRTCIPMCNIFYTRYIDTVFSENRVTRSFTTTLIAIICTCTAGPPPFYYIISDRVYCLPPRPIRGRILLRSSLSCARSPRLCSQLWNVVFIRPKLHVVTYRMYIYVIMFVAMTLFTLCIKWKANSPFATIYYQTKL